MPFDAAPVMPDALTLARTALRDLAAKLRDPDLDKVHVWDFGNLGECYHLGVPHELPMTCGTIGCALGVARLVPSCVAIWPRGAYDRNYSSAAFASNLRTSGIPAYVVESIFYAGYTEDSKRYPQQRATVTLSNVSPIEVADRIDHWLATGEIK